MLRLVILKLPDILYEDVLHILGEMLRSGGIDLRYSDIVVSIYSARI